MGREDMGEAAIAAYERGSADNNKLRTEIEATWREVTRDPRLRSKIAAILDVAPEVVDHSGPPPVEVEAPRSGMTGGELVLIAVSWVGMEVLLGTARDLAKDVIKVRVRALWDDVLLPALSERLPERRSIGREQRTAPERT